MPEHPGGEMVKVTLLALRDDVDFAVRLRRLLKTCLRSLRLKCVRVEDVAAVRSADEKDRPAERTPGAFLGRQHGG